MSDLCVIALTGRLVSEPRFGENAYGKWVGFRIACNLRVKDPDTGRFTERPQFIDCFGEQPPDFDVNELHKGTQVGVQGAMVMEYRAPRDGSPPHSSPTVRLDDVEITSQPRKKQWTASRWDKDRKD